MKENRKKGILSHPGRAAFYLKNEEIKKMHAYLKEVLCDPLTNNKLKKNCK